MNSDPIQIQDYILEDENKLRTAAAVFDAWVEVRTKLVLSFLDRLKCALQLKKELEGWEFELWGRPFINSGAGFSFGKPEWKKEYDVSLSLLDYGQYVKVGLGRNADLEHIKKRPHCDELLTAVSKLHPSARAKKWWEAAVTLQSPAAHWQEPKVLWQMHTDPKFLEDVADQLLGVAEISERIVDRFVDQFARKK